jgi:glycine cleavage system H protein
MNIADFRFTKEHEWVGAEGDVAGIGISDYAQKELGDVVYVELPALGDRVSQGSACANIESVKAVSDIYAPVSGEVIEINEALEGKPELINQSPYHDGWICKIKMDNPAELDKLMDKAAYDEYLKGILED